MTLEVFAFGKKGCMVSVPSRFDDRVYSKKERRPSSLIFTIAPSAECACKARLAITKFISRAHRNAEAVAEFMLAVGEALANAIEHGASAKEIRISVEMQSSNVTVTIEDDGRGFVAEDTSAGKLPSLEAERGRGLPIIFYYTDSFTIDSRHNAGTIVALRRDLR